LFPAVLEIAFKLTETQTIVVDEGEAAQLGLHLAVFGRDEEMPRSRLLAEKIATAIELAFQGEPALLQLSRLQRADIRAALDAMIDSRGELSSELGLLRDACGTERT
jgi:hypothetical protein